MNKSITNYTLMKRIMVLYPGLFELKKDELGKHCFYFVDKRILDGPLFLFKYQMFFTGQVECEISNHSFTNDKSYLSLVLNVNLEEVSEQKGLFNMNRDRKLCDESAMGLYAHNLLIRYLDIGKSGYVCYVSYNRPAIERRATIQNIINHE